MSCTVRVDESIAYIPEPVMLSRIAPVMFALDAFMNIPEQVLSRTWLLERVGFEPLIALIPIEPFIEEMLLFETVLLEFERYIPFVLWVTRQEVMEGAEFRTVMAVSVAAFAPEMSALKTVTSGLKILRVDRYSRFEPFMRPLLPDRYWKV